MALQDNPKNPANVPSKRVTAASRIPMSVPTLALATPEIQGYHLHWGLGKNIPRMLQAGYEYVDPDEVTVANRGVADDLESSGSTDLGSRISVIAGTAENGTAERLYLMKIKEEWRNTDLKAMEEMNDKVAQKLRGGLVGAEQDPEPGTRYLKQGAGLFFPKNRKV